MRILTSCQVIASPACRMCISSATGNFVRDTSLKSTSALATRLVILPLIHLTKGQRTTYQKPLKRRPIIVTFSRVESNRLAWFEGFRLHALCAPGSSIMGKTLSKKSGSCRTGEEDQDCPRMNRHGYRQALRMVYGGPYGKSFVSTSFNLTVKLSHVASNITNIKQSAGRTCRPRAWSACT